MKTTKHLLTIGALFLLSSPLALCFKDKKPAQAQALDTRIFDVVFNANQTLDEGEIFTQNLYGSIGHFMANFYFTYEESRVDIFNVNPIGVYLNDHPDAILDSESNPIDITEGIIINGKTLKFWSEYDKYNLNNTAYPDSTGVQPFPMNEDLGGSYHFACSAVAALVKPGESEFKLNLDLFSMDEIEITFKKDKFYSYYEDHIYKLAEDVTYYSALNSEAPANARPAQKITFVRKANEVLAKFTITNQSITSKTNGHGYGLKIYQLFTNIPRDEERFNSVYPADSDRYLYGNILLNGKPLTYYNSKARANCWDFTNLAGSVQNPKYDTGHPTGAVNTVHDLAARIDLALDEKYIIAVYIPDQLFVDFEIDNPVISLREGSSWFTKDGEGNPVVARNIPSAFDDKIANAILELDSYVDLSLYSATEANAITQIIYAAQTDVNNASFYTDIDVIVAKAKENIDKHSTIEEEHVTHFVELLNAIPTSLDDEEAYVNATVAAKDAYAYLTESEKDKVSTIDVFRLSVASAALDVIYLNDYKDFVKKQIVNVIDINQYRNTEKSAIQNLINEANDEISKATTKDEVIAAYEKLLPLIAPYKTAATLAKEELDAIDLSVYRTAQKKEVELIIAEGKVVIEGCHNASEVNEALERILNLISTVKTSAQMDADEELKPVKDAAKNELTNYANDKGKDNYDATNWALILNYVDLGHLAIDAAMDEDEIAQAVESAKIDIDSVETKSAEGGKKCGGSVVATSVLLSVISLTGAGLLIVRKRKQK